MQHGSTRIAALLAALCAALATAPAAAQNAANGELLYSTPTVAGKLSCSASACHGSLTTPQNRIVNGTQASNIKAATQRVSQMLFLNGPLTDAQFNDLAAYIAGRLGGTPSYLQVVATPTATLAPASVNFGSSELRVASATQTVTVGNAASASAPLVLGAISTTAGSDFAVAGGSCRAGDSLPVAASCTVLLSFTPSATGTRSAQLNVVHSGAGGASSLALTGTGTNTSAVAAVSPSTLSFSQTVGSSSGALRVLVGNTGSGTLRLAALRIEGAQAGEFALVDGATCTAGASVASGQNCHVDLRFTPAAQGLRNGSLAIEHNDVSGRSTVALAGWGNSSPQPGLALNAYRLELGEQFLGSTGTAQVLTLINNGQAALALSGITVQGSQASEFIVGGSCAVGTPVAAGGTCTVGVAFAPAALGARSASLNIASNAPSGAVTIPLAGTGVPEAAPVVRLSQAALGFGTVALGGSSAPRTLTLTNAGNAPLLLGSLRSSSTEFALTHDCPASLAPAASCTLRVSFSPTSANASEVLVISSNAPSSPNNVVLTGLGSSASLAVFDWLEGGAPIVFGDAAVGAATDPVTRTLINRGPGSATLNALNVSGADALSFVVGGGSCVRGQSLAMGTSCTVAMRFAPAAAGARSALLQATTTGSNPPELALGGTGSGVAVSLAALAAQPVALDYRATVITTGSHSDPLSVRIVNESASASTMAAVRASEGFAVLSPEGADACPGVPWTLAPGAACSVRLQFAPATGGSASGKLSVVTSGGQTTEVALSGEAKTVMTNVGSTEGGGALGLPMLGLLAIAVAVAAALRKPSRAHRRDRTR